MSGQVRRPSNTYRPVVAPAPCPLELPSSEPPICRRMSNLKRAELVQLAQTNLKDLAYLGNVSEHLLPAVDVACVKDQDILPAHSYVLMAASPVFAELVAAHFAGVIKGDCQPGIITVPMPETTAETAKLALQYLYEQCSFRGKEPEIAALCQAKGLASFAHKWNIQVMLEAADVFIRKTLAEVAGPPATTYCSVRRKAVEANFDYSNVAVYLIDTFAFAEKLHLVNSLEFCTAWLINHFRRFQGEYPKLFVLGQDNVIKIMRGVAKNLTK
ncbi:TPA: hypothetical protein ACH3X2_008307 [Trebouxia sp. C0005]